MLILTRKGNQDIMITSIEIANNSRCFTQTWTLARLKSLKIHGVLLRPGPQPPNHLKSELSRAARYCESGTNT